MAGDQDDGEFRLVWQRLVPARQFAAMLIEYRADHGLSQRALAQRLGSHRPRVARMESGEHDPDVETIIATVAQLGTEFVLSVAPVDPASQLLSKRARAAGSMVDHHGVVVTAASTD